MSRALVQRALYTAVAAVAVMGLQACTEDEALPTGNNGNTQEPALNEVVTTQPLNASSTDTLVYFSFATRGLVPKTSSWDLALRRYEIRVNSSAIAGTSTRNVTAYSMNNNENATPDQVLGFTAANTLSAFTAVDESQIPTDDKFTSDRLIANPNAFLNLSGIPSANSAQYWKIRLANGSYALFHVTNIAFTSNFQFASSITIESRLQTGNTLGAPQTLTVTTNNATQAISLATNSVVTKNGCNWDLEFDPAGTALTLTVNTGCNVGTYPGNSSPTFASATSASDAPDYAANLSQLVGPIANSVTDKKAPFRYNLTGNDRLHPSFNTYLVKSGAKVYKLQVIDYYSATGASGYPTLRYARIR